MPNFSKLFQEEVRRLARKEAKTDLDRVKKDTAELRRALSAARKEISALQQAVKQAGKLAGKAAAGTASTAATAAKAAPKGKEKEDGRKRITGKSIINLRTKLGLTQGEFAALLGVTGQSIYQWEHKEGALKFRGGAKERLQAIKGIGAREARKRLAELNITRKRGPRSK